MSEQLIPSATGAPNSAFGWGVAITPGQHAILVGAPLEDFVGDQEFIDALGELYVFRKAHGVWAQTQETRPGGGRFSEFGDTIAAGGGRLI